MNSCREIITLQIGHYSNFIGTHWWNLQHSSFVYKSSSTATDPPEINHDVLFREGSLQNGEITYTPRLLLLDAKGTLGTLPQSGQLYECSSYASANCNTLWNEKVDIVDQLPQEKNDYLTALEEEDQLYFGARDEDKDVCYEDTLQESSHIPITEKVFDISKQVNVWSDFLRPHLHPRNIFVLRDVWHQDINASSTWGFQGGVSLFKREEIQEEITDRIRILAESCESLQGFHLLSDSHNGMGGISWGVAQHLADEYKSKDLITFLSTPPHLSSLNLTDSSFFLSSLTQCYSELSQLSSVIVPFNLKQHSWHTWAEDVRWPYINYERDSPYVTSTILASFLDTATWLYRKRSNAIPMAYVSNLLTPLHRKFVSASISLPLGVDQDTKFMDWLQKNEGLDLVSLSGGVKDTKVLCELQMLRGVSKFKLSVNDDALTSPWEKYEEFLKLSGKLSSNQHVCGTIEPLKIDPPFPRIFKKEIQDGGLVSQASKFPLQSVANVNLATGLHQGDGIQRYLEQVLEGAAALNVSKIPKLSEEGVDADFWKDVMEDMRNLLGCYGSKIGNHDDSDIDLD